MYISLRTWSTHSFTHYISTIIIIKQENPSDVCGFFEFGYYFCTQLAALNRWINHMKYKELTINVYPVWVPYYTLRRILRQPPRKCQDMQNWWTIWVVHKVFICFILYRVSCRIFENKQHIFIWWKYCIGFWVDSM